MSLAIAEVAARVRVAGVPFWLPTREELATAMDVQLRASPGSVTTVSLYTLNPELLTYASRDAAYQRVLNVAEWKVVDGAGVAISIRLRGGAQLRRRYAGVSLRHPGSDIIHDLAECTERAKRPLLIVGGRQDRLDKACARLRELYPRLRVHGVSPAFSPTLPLRDQPELEALVESLRPATVVACLGSPKQEIWIDQSRPCFERADVRIATGLGGTVDFLSGEVPRAPTVLRRFGFEWAYRLWVEPSRWRRQVRSLPWFAAKVLFAPGFVECIRGPDAGCHD